MEQDFTSDRITVVAGRTVKDEDLPEVMDLYAGLARESRREPGNISYEVFRDLEDPCSLVIIEEWESQAALDAHFQAPHFLEIVPRIREKVLRGEIRRLRQLSP